MGFEGTQLDTGSGVIASYIDGRRYLITARHNSSGRRPGSDIPISDHGGFPNQLRIEGCNVDFGANLYGGDNDPNADFPLYATHSSGSVIDVTALRIPSEIRIFYPLDSSFFDSAHEFPIAALRRAIVLHPRISRRFDSPTIRSCDLVNLEDWKHRNRTVVRFRRSA